MDTAARLLAQELADHTGPEAGEHAVLSITPERTDPPRVTVRMRRRDAPRTPGEDLVHELLLTDREPVQELVQRLVLRLTAQDHGDPSGPR
ncbi:hypothetical protein ACFQL8_20600 [Streptomyces goshikiensis]|uniref:hypothetical protein n=1 Tax=Streptomyces goshikiensis TaxID=1942 RepID=UPI001678D6B8|nr:hypothetical protein [Streptomyces goshikiensis]